MLVAVFKCHRSGQANKGRGVWQHSFRGCSLPGGTPCGANRFFLVWAVFGHLCPDFKMFVTFHLVIPLLRLCLKELQNQMEV